MGWGLKNLGTRGRIVGAGAVTHFFQCDPARAKADVASVLAASPAEQCFVGHFGPVTRDEVVAFVEAPRWSCWSREPRAVSAPSSPLT